LLSLGVRNKSPVVRPCRTSGPEFDALVRGAQPPPNRTGSVRPHENWRHLRGIRHGARRALARWSPSPQQPRPLAAARVARRECRDSTPWALSALALDLSLPDHGKSRPVRPPTTATTVTTGRRLDVVWSALVTYIWRSIHCARKIARLPLMLGKIFRRRFCFVLSAAYRSQLDRRARDLQDCARS
jgi:hypothetical protein